MEHHEFWVSVQFNRYIAEPIAAWLGYHPHGNHDVVPDYLVMIILVALGLILFAAILGRRLSVEQPGNVQQVVELVVEFIQGFMKDLIGPHNRRYFPLLGTLFFFILVCNLIGLIPGFMSPTSNINVTAGCAVIVFLYYNFHGFRAQGFTGYMAHFAGGGAVHLVLAVLLFCVEILSHLARPFSLSVRLFGNIFAEELIITTLNGMFPLLLSLPVMGLAIFASTIQAFIFIVLTMVYLGGAVEHAHDESDASQKGVEH